MTDTNPAHAADTSDMPAASPPASAAYEPDFAPVIRSKIQPPPLRADTLTRERLMKRLDDAVKSRVTIVTADAGYGKSTLLADYAAQRGVRTLWYRLSSTDTNTVTWVNYLLAACREVDRAFGDRTGLLLGNTGGGEFPRSEIVESLLGDLTRWHEAPTLLVLDDFHEADRFTEVTDLVQRLIDDGPDWLHLVIVGRRRPNLAVSRLVAAADLTQIGTADLRFSLEETQRLFTETYAHPLDANVLAFLSDRTRGWAASLSLFRQSIRGRTAAEVRRILDTLSGATSPLYDFLAEEVLSSVPDDLQTFLLKVSLLESVAVEVCMALFGGGDPRHETEVQSWIDQAAERSLLSRSSDTSDASVMHPLLREFLGRQLRSRFGQREIEGMHLTVARQMRAKDPLVAAHHFIEGGDSLSAMECLGHSILGTIGSGKWGIAADLLDRLADVPADPAVAAIRARRLLDDGNPAAAQRALASVDLGGCSPPVRAVVRQTLLMLAWRTADKELLLRTISDVRGDSETPTVLRDIAQIFVDGGSFAGNPAELPLLGNRLVEMARNQRMAGHTFYSAVSLHNACVAFMNAGDAAKSLEVGTWALEAFGSLGFEVAEKASCEVMVAVSLLELGRQEAADDHIRAAMTGKEFADVPAEMSWAFSTIGARDRAAALLLSANELHSRGRSDSAGVGVIDVATAMTLLPQDPKGAIRCIAPDTSEWALDLGQGLNRLAVLAQAYFLAGDTARCVAVTSAAIGEARRRRARRALVRLRVIDIVARGADSEFSDAVAEAAGTGELALAEVADVVCASPALRPQNPAIRKAILRLPSRWLPALRRQLGKGAPHGDVAAALLDEFGELEDVGRLRAYAKTYRQRGPQQMLGVALANRASPKLHISDLGPVKLAIGQRSFALSGMRRKAAALLMYLATRPSFSANREQVLDELWPSADPESATNSLNQSLYFARRDIDPWYEDGVSADYIHFAGDLVWLDPSLVSTQSRQFLSEASKFRSSSDGAKPQMLVASYTGHFAPEFEYEEWAITWRTRLHAALLEVAQTAVDGLISSGALAEARDTAAIALEADPTATDIQRRLVWLQWHLGARSAARAQFEHLRRLEEEEGGTTPQFKDLVELKVPR